VYKYLQTECGVDVPTLKKNIEQVIIKTLISVQPSLTTPVTML
jgi:hypothetical protein